MPKKLKYILAIEAVVFIAFHLLRMSFSGIFSTIAAFPFEQAGLGLRSLSLSGMAGNILAIILYLLIGMLPAVVYFWLRKRQKAYKMDYMLLGISMLLFIVIYYMINPVLFQANVPGTEKWMLGCTFYSVFFGYLIIRILKTYANADVKKLQEGMKLLLFSLNLIFVYAICGQSLEELIASIQEVHSGNTMFGIHELALTYLFLILHYIVGIFPYLLDIAVTFLAVHMLDALSADRYSEEAVTAVKRLAGFCVKALTATMAADVAFNLLQMVCHKQLYQVDIVIVIPALSVVFVLAALLFSRYIQEDQKLKQDNDLFI